MREKVIKYCRELANGHQQYSITRMAEVANGIVAVEFGDTNECDILFDTKQWQFVNPKWWERERGEESQFPHIHGCLGLIEGLRSTQGSVSTIENATDFARQCLSQRGSQMWHDTPQFFTF